MTFPIKIISGGQSGVDRAALDAAFALNIECGGSCPKGRKAEDGPIPDKYPLTESTSFRYEDRTLQNVLDGDGTLILSWGKLSAGTALTLRLAQKNKKPFLILDLQKRITSKKIKAWIQEYQIKTLNIAGPRESHAPGKIYKRAYQVCLKLLKPGIR